MKCRYAYQTFLTIRPATGMTTLFDCATRFVVLNDIKKRQQPRAEMTIKVKSRIPNKVIKNYENVKITYLHITFAKPY